MPNPIVVADVKYMRECLGMKWREVAAELGVSVSRAHAIGKAARLTRRQGRGLTPYRRVALIRRLNRGETDQVISIALGVSSSSVLRWRRALAQGGEM